MLKVLKPAINLIILVVLSVYLCSAQSLPPVAHFQTEDYQADNQNWSITQTQDNTLFFANGKGLLMYDGEYWKLLGSPNNTILRSVFAVDNKVYSGAYMEFGIWEKNTFGNYVYTSLSKDLDLIEDEQFWTISSLEDNIIFQSLDAIYMYDTQNKRVNTIKAEGEITKMVIVDKELYFHVKNSGLYKLINGQKVLINDSRVIKSCTLINIYSINNEYYAQTQFNGIINLYSNLEYKPSNSENIWDSLSVYSSIQTSDGDIYLGTISDGLFKISKDSIVYNLNQKNTLSNNTVLSVFKDHSNNIWLGLDNGINIIDDDSDILIYNDKNGQLGTIYTSITHNGILYVGSNQGLFYFDSANNKFSLVYGTSGQVWSLFSFNDTLFCGHHNGTFIINGYTSEYIENTRGTWAFQVSDDKTVLSGNYDGLYLYVFDDKWKLDRKIPGFDISTQYFEFVDANTILVNHEYKGIIKLNLNEKLTQVIDYETIKSVDKGLFSSIVKFQDNIYYAYKDGVFKYRKDNSLFEKDTILSKIISQKNFTTGVMIRTQDDKLWLFNKTDVINVSISSLKDHYLINKIPIKSELRQQISGYENISFNGEDAYLIGRNDGFIEINSNKSFEQNPKVYLRDVIVKNKENLTLKDFELSNIKNEFNNISFQFSSFNYNPLFKSEYQYKLVGYNENWSSWQENAQITFKNLAFGDYTLCVKSRVGEDSISEIEKIQFAIEKPFYLSTSMILVYVFVLIVFAFCVHMLYKIYYKKQKISIQKEADRKLKLKELESQKELMNLNNKQLKLDIDNKSRELAISTMSLIKKNEFLSNIKSDLKTLKNPDPKVRKVLKSIDKNIDSQDDWQFFEKAFNNADKEFFKKLKEYHPSLTHNDFKLCAYLRLNLSSKEIAPLFNISTKSVEIKRYRLRKKMNLDRDQSLTDYILSI
jgi:DNA-binding CsgD family transcriptional regulator/ligand-binding sensor domain-containing protein